MTPQYYVIPGLVDPSIKRLECAVTKRMGITVSDLHKKSRKKPLPYSRQLLVYFARKMLKMKWREISVLFNPHHDRCTLIRGYARINGFVKVKDEETISNIENIKKELNKTS